MFNQRLSFKKKQDKKGVSQYLINMSIDKFYFSNTLPLRSIKTQSDKIIGFAKRDSEELLTMGITPQLITNLEEKSQELFNFLTYDENVGEKKILTDDRNQKIIVVKDFIEKLRSQLRLVFGKKTANYDAIFTKRLTNINVEEFIETAHKTLSVLTSTTQDLSIYAVTTEVIADFATKIDELIAAHNQQVSATSTVSNNTLDRSELRREVYQLLEHISNIGKIYWKKKNPAKSENYKIILTKTVATPATDSTIGVF